MNETLEIDLEVLATTQPHRRVIAKGLPEAKIPQEVEITTLQRIVLRCGKSSLTLYPDGKIVLRGENILSEAEDCNRVAGGRIELN